MRRPVPAYYVGVLLLVGACAKSPVASNAANTGASTGQAGTNAGALASIGIGAGASATTAQPSAGFAAASQAGRASVAGRAGAAAAGSGTMRGSTAGSAGGAGTSATTNTAGVVAAGGGGGAGPKPPAGMAAYKGVANSPCAARTMLNVSWYYNWMQAEKEPCGDGRGGEFVPMIWGHTGAEQTAADIASSITSFVKHGYGNVLGFNEPDNSSQANIPVAKAISLWPSFSNTGLRVGSPGTQANANPGQTWFKDFMGQVNANPALQTDFLAIHWYGWNAGSCDAKASQLESYLRWAEGIAGNRPIWITEWGCLNASAPDTATVVAFLKGAIAMLAKHPRVERYAWYPWATNCGLVDANGKLTELGNVYATAPAYK